MEAFKIPEPLINISDIYPRAETILEAAKTGGWIATTAIARLWLSEGIPFAFKSHPGLYEVVRTWLSGRLDVDAKEISIYGSSRIGESLAPYKLGAAFNENSDLDFFIVSTELFDRVREDFNKWSYDFESSVVQPSNDREKGFWKDNITRGPKILQKGFIDPKMVPNLPNYPTVINIAQTMWLLTEKLNVTNRAPKIGRSSLRCYKTWKDFVTQVSINLTPT